MLRSFRPLALTVAAVVCVVAAIAAFAAVRPPGSSDDSAVGDATVVRVVDGDTLVADVAGSEEPVRLIGIDTPETVAPGRPVECYGAEASHRLAELVPAGTAVRLERDVEARDAYDRLLAYVYRSDDDLFVNRAQVDGGFAEADDYPPNTAWRADLEHAERAARTARTGLWGTCGGTDVPVAPPPAGQGDDTGTRP